MSQDRGDSTHPLLVKSSNLRRRHAVNLGMVISAWAAAILAVGVLLLVVGSVFAKGISSIKLSFFTENTANFGGGGIGNALIGTAELVGLATLFAVPFGVLIAIYTSEFAGRRSGSAIRFVLDILNGVPTIVTGLFVFGILVAGTGQSGLAGAVALAIVMLPLVARSCHEVLALVPESVREAGLALGASRWRTTLSVVLPTALSGMITGALLAVARAMGETAPLLFTTSIFPDLVQTNLSQAVPNIPVTIFRYSEAPDPVKHAQAWGAALILILFVLAISIVARTLSARTRRRLGAAR
jgi:phosphate transport system permease protein